MSVCMFVSAVNVSMALLPTRCPKLLLTHETSAVNFSMSSVHSGAETRDATGFTHLVGWLQVPWAPSPRQKKILREARCLLCTVEQRPARPHASLILLAVCQFLGCSAPIYISRGVLRAAASDIMLATEPLRNLHHSFHVWEAASDILSVTEQSRHLQHSAASDIMSATEPSRNLQHSFRVWEAASGILSATEPSRKLQHSFRVSWCAAGSRFGHHVGNRAIEMFSIHFVSIILSATESSRNL